MSYLRTEPENTALLLCTIGVHQIYHCDSFYYPQSQSSPYPSKLVQLKVSKMGAVTQYTKKRTSASSDFKKRKFDDKTKSSSTDDGQSASNKKRALKHERQSHRKHADIVVAGKELWNKMRLKSNTKEEIAAMMSELMSLFRGKFNDVAMQHDASRIVQAAIQFGNDDQRLEIVQELSSNVSELSKVQYAHFAVLKMIKYCSRNKDAVKIVVKVSIM